MLGFEPIASEPICSHFQTSGMPFNPSMTYPYPISGQAEVLYFGQPAFVVSDTGTNAALLATATPGSGQLVRVFRADVTFSAAPAAGTLITVYDDTTEIWEVVLAAAGRLRYTLDFQRKPIRGSRGNAVSVGVTAAGTDVVQTVAFTGDKVMAP